MLYSGIKKSIIFIRAHSAGSGVCMMSEKMWTKLLKQSGFQIVEKKISEADKWSFIKKILLLNKGYRQECFLTAERVI